MIFPSLQAYADWPLLFLRIIVGIVFISSGWSHVNKPEQRSQSIGMSKGMTILIGLGELAGAIGIILGIFIQIAALILIVIMAGAIYKKQVEWKIGFYGEKSTGWHYDLIFLIANLVFLFTGGGSIRLI